ncbi:MAG: restriction endonuclease subunit S [Nostoc sp. NMS7]|uniref:restriction endonuclease subunit S n=1 Tax=Nostoc sp. NMS7 TaxID=2815391 RepID=UPI0025FBFC63|nr:restriction endonuclease subunit S [Nostoc sp. NMS7]MBN3951299.1 restriction endonuclease subunit S [Nostoc sp. NMS7]
MKKSLNHGLEGLRDDTAGIEGYKKTEVGVIPDDWEVKRLGDIADIKTGPFGSSLHEKDYVEDGTPIITVEHLGEKGVVHKNLPMVSHADKNRLSAYILKTGDIVFSRVGSVDRNSLISDVENGWLFSSRLLRIRINPQNISPAYLSYHFHQEPTKQRIRSVAVGQTMASLNTEILKNIEVILPPTRLEQKAIAQSLSDVDALITECDRIISKKRNTKQGTMQQLLTGKKRLPGFSGKWEVKKLEEVTAITRLAGAEYSSVWKEDDNGEIIALRGFNIVKNRIIEKDLARISNELSLKLNRSRLYRGDVVYPCVGTIGNAAVIEEDDKYHIQQNIAKITPIKSVLSSYYLAHYLISPLGLDEVLRFNATSSQPNVLVGSLRKYRIPLTSIPEQKAIAQILSDMDTEIAGLEQKRDKYKAIKQGMMQELLTGKTRLKYDLNK